MRFFKVATERTLELFEKSLTKLFLALNYFMKNAKLTNCLQSEETLDYAVVEESFVIKI